MLIEALAGGLSGAGCCTEASAPMHGETDGVFLVAVKIAAFTPLLDFQRTMGRLVQHVKSSPRAPGLAEILVPGELEAKTRRDRLRQGIPLEPATVEALEQILSRFDLAIEMS
jgi:LDH2 family malate/lactate/ureidoglycolate dehydrogenase